MERRQAALRMRSAGIQWHPLLAAKSLPRQSVLWRPRRELRLVWNARDDAVRIIRALGRQGRKKTALDLKSSAVSR